MAKNYALESVVLHPSLQCRVSVSEEVIDEYGRLLRDGVKLPAVSCVRVKGEILLTDGFARYMAHDRIGKTRIACEVVDGSMEDAIRQACRANSTHGVPRSVDDRRNALVLARKTWPELSNRQLAELCGVSRWFVDKHLPNPKPAELSSTPNAVRKRKAREAVAAPAVGGGDGGGVAVAVPATAARAGAPVASPADTREEECRECFNNQMVLTDAGWVCSLCFVPAPDRPVGDLEGGEAAVSEAAASFDVVEVSMDDYKDFLSHIGRAIRSASRAGLLGFIGSDLEAVKAKAIKIAEGK